MRAVAMSSQQSLNPMSLEEASTYLQTFDLTPVIERLIHIENWSKKQALMASQLYRNFLFLKKKYGKDSKLPPSYEIDEVWHAHVLHTKDYVAFCEKVYGEYLHHHPHLANQHDDVRKLEKLFERTQEFFYKEFGSYIYAIRRKPISLKKLLRDFFRRQKSL